MSITIEVSKSGRTLKVFDGGNLVKSYPCCTGRVAGDKQHEGDCRTPEGVFHVCYKNPHSQYTLSLGLSYPNKEHAARGLRDGMITQQQYDAIAQANDLTAKYSSSPASSAPTPAAKLKLGTVTMFPLKNMVTVPGLRADSVVTIDGADWEALWKTPLGGEVMIHGGGSARDGTAGCVGLDDADIAELYPMIPIGTAVAIRP